MPFYLSVLLNFQGSTHLFGVGSFSKFNTEKVQITANPSDNNNHGSATLDWGESFTRDIGETYSYRVFRSSEGWNNKDKFQSIGRSIDYDNAQVENINVLNIYPDNGARKQKGESFGISDTSIIKYGDKNLPLSASLKAWMENHYDTDGTDEPAGKGIITVDPVSYTEFNQNPESYINAKWSKEDQKANPKHKAGRDKYNVIFIGTWDANAESEFTSGKTGEGTNAIAALKKWVESGKGLISGHDTLFSKCSGWVPEVGRASETYTSAMKEYYNIKIHGYDDVAGNVGEEQENTSSQVKITKKGLFTDYPWNIGELGDVLPPIPTSHTSGQVAFGDVWLEFDNPSIRTGKNGSGNACFYLTTWNNTAMVQTGHSNCETTKEERHLLANLIFYMDQVLWDTRVKDDGAQDVESPEMPNAENQIQKINYSEVYELNDNINELTLSATDKGSDYWYYVNAYAGNNLVASSKDGEEKHVNITTHTQSYLYSYDNEERKKLNDKNGTVVNSTSTGSAILLNEENGSLDKKLKLTNLANNNQQYLHVAAVDGAGNVGPTITIKIPENKVSYRVEQYLEDADGTYSKKPETYYSGTIGESISYEQYQEGFSGYEYDSTNKNNVKTITLTEGIDNVLRLYYKRKQYKVTYSYENAPSDAPCPPEETDVKWGENVQVAQIRSLDGYTFSGWKTTDVQVSSAGKFTMPQTNVKFIGTWTKNPEPEPDPDPEPVKPEPQKPSTSSTVTWSGRTAPSTPTLNTFDHYAYIIGYPDKSVHPTGEITRAETAEMFFRLLTEKVRDSEFAKVNGSPAYTDVKSGSWYYSAVAVMKNLQIVNGYPDGSFKPNSPITRAEFAAMAERFNTNHSAANGTAAYSDIAGHWAEEEIKRASADGWICGYPDGTFQPQKHISRAESMAIVNRMLRRYPDKAYAFNLQSDPDLNTWTDNQDRSRWYYLDVQEATNSHIYYRTATARKNNNKTYAYNTEWWKDVTKAPDWSRYYK